MENEGWQMSLGCMHPDCKRVDVFIDRNKTMVDNNARNAGWAFSGHRGEDVLSYVFCPKHKKEAGVV